MTSRRTPVTVAVQPWFADHCFDQKIVLPAVESMLLLATAVAGLHPEIDIRVMEDVRFSKFLEIPAGSTRLEVLVEDQRGEKGAILARLLSRVQYKAMTRLKEHGEILFPARTDGGPVPGAIPAPSSAPEAEVSAEEVYRELVPFGAAYHTLRETLYLAGEYAWGNLRAPALPLADGVGEILGSPFPLDGAFHAACVLGQRFADFVPFPVGFARRVVTRPTQAGGHYRARVHLISRTRDELLFDLSIVDDQDQVYESVNGVRMRDVSGGRIKPPDWIRRGQRP